MNKENNNFGDAKLFALLRESRVSPPLPPCFQENVWRRIEDAEAPVKAGSWLEALAVLTLRPKFAFATVAALLVAGALLGVRAGSQTVRQDEQARYVATVAPGSLR